MTPGQGEMYPPTSSSQRNPIAHPSSQTYQQDYGSPTYSIAGRPVSPDSNYNTSVGSQFPNTPYTTAAGPQYPNAHNMQWAEAHAAQVPPFLQGQWSTACMAPEGPQSAWPYDTSQSGDGDFSSPPGAYPAAQYPAAQYPPASAPASTSTSISGVKRCSHCGATSTPHWRRNPTANQTLCNACGL